MPVQQFSDTEPTSPQSGSGISPSLGGGGFDFGLSRPKTGLGYGLLGDARSLGSGQTCDDCPPDAPCPNCAGSTADASDNNDGQVIPAQYPIPMPGWLPPPVIGAQPKSSSPPVVGDPNAWWNKGDADIADWIGGWAATRPSEDVEEMCWERYMLDTIDCNLKKAYAGSGAARVCHEQAAAAYSDCKKQGKQSDIPRYDRN